MTARARSMAPHDAHAYAAPGAKDLLASHHTMAGLATPGRRHQHRAYQAPPGGSLRDSRIVLTKGLSVIRAAARARPRT
jgi:hypothetical protein